MDKANPQAESMVIGINGKIKAIGNFIPLKNTFPNAESIDLHNKIVLPGFNDAHIHVWKVGHLRTFMLDLRGTPSIEECKQKLKKFAEDHKNAKWILARGLNEEILQEKRLPTKEDLDEVIPNKPIFIIRTCAHIGIANSLAMHQSNVDKHTEVPFGGEIKKHPNGELNGLFTERALGLIMNHIPPFTKEEYQKMIGEAQDYLLSLGITSATDPAAGSDLLAAYTDLDQKGLLKMRFNVFPLRIPDGSNLILPLPDLYQSEHLQITTVKFFADGGLSSATAAINVPYKNTDHDEGLLRLPYDLFLQTASEAVSHGFHVATHAIGHKAVDLCLDVYEKLNQINQHLTHRIEHLGFLEEKNIPAFQELKIAVAMQPIFIYELANNFKNTLPDELLEVVYPTRSVLDAHITLALSTDGPVVKEINPFTNIATAITRQSITGDTIGIHQKISLDEALYAYTMGGAKMDDQESTKGSLSIGKVADFIVVDQNPYTCSDLKQTQVLETWINGNRVFSDSELFPEPIAQQNKKANLCSSK